jgi:uncharacterized protein
VVVVADSSVITGLLALRKIELLHFIFGQVLITNSVNKELSSLKDFGYDIKNLDKSWIKIAEIENFEQRNILLKRLDPGEADSIILAIEKNADFLLMDEKKGRKIAKEIGLQVVGLVGILIQSKKLGLILSLKSELQFLTSKLEFRMSDELIERALKEVGEQ